MEFRPYQADAVESLYRYFAAKKGNPIIAMPTGTGKSVVIGGFVRSVFESYPNQRVLKLTHVKELIEQNFEKLLRLWPTAPAGIYSAGLGRRDIRPITYGGIGSLFKQSEQIGHVDLVIVDECHLVNGKDGTMYSKLLADLKKINPYLKVIGLSATPYRLGLGLLTEGGVFTDVCYDNTGREAFNRLIAEGYLLPLIPKRTAHELDVSGVRIQGGEFVQGELQRAVDKETITYYALKEMVTHASERRSWLIFTTGVDHTEHVAEMLQKEFDILARPVHSKMSGEERDTAIRMFRAGKLQCLVNNNVLTTGFDNPEIDMIGVLRPTNSPVLWVQMLGRGTRPVYAPGYNLNTLDGRLAAIAASTKQNCLVLDFAANTKRLGPVNDPVLPKRRGKGGGGGMAPVRICEACNTYNHASAAHCCHCGHAFDRAVKFGTTAGTQELIAGDMPQVVVFKVDRVTYTKHLSRSNLMTLKATYYCGLRRFEEYICIEHSGLALHKAHRWWRSRYPYNSAPAPVTQDGKSWTPRVVDEALYYAPKLRVPTHVRVWINKKHPEVMDYDFTNTGFTVDSAGHTGGSRSATSA